MSHYGGVAVYRPTYTKPDPADPSKRITHTSPHYAYRFDYRGRAYQKAGFRTASDARREGERRKEEVRAGLEDDWRKFTVLGLYQLAAARKVTMDGSTQVSFEAVWKRLRRHFPDHVKVVDLDDTELLRFVAARKAEGAAVNTIKLDLQHLRTAMSIANKKRRLPWLPEFPRLKYQRREQTVHQVELSQIVRTMPAYYGPFFGAAEEIGWRARSELRSREWAHVDWGPTRWSCECDPPVMVEDDECAACGTGRPGWLELDAAHSKTDAPRVFPMTKRLRGILMAARLHIETLQRKQGRVIRWVFCRDDGQPIGDYRSAWQDACRRAGVEKLAGRKGPWSSSKVVHDLRRTAIRRWAKQGIEKDSRKGMAGHSTDEAHALYEAKGADPDSLRAIALRLDKLRDAEKDDPKVVQLDLFRAAKG